jgi:uncharacterized damage-inducible protein DinB
MSIDKDLTASIYNGWQAYNEVMINTLASLDTGRLALRAAPNLRSIGETTAHIVGARARWFYLLMGEGGDAFKAFGRWDRQGAKPRSAEDLASSLLATWTGMQETIACWTAEDWEKSWPGEDDGEPEVITRQWVIWHLIEHDLHHGGELSIVLGMHGLPGIPL